jgi:hypothetical protein
VVWTDVAGGAPLLPAVDVLDRFGSFWFHFFTSTSTLSAYQMGWDVDMVGRRWFIDGRRGA